VTQFPYDNKVQVSEGIFPNNPKIKDDDYE